jgi:hypothetical protein
MECVNELVSEHIHKLLHDTQIHNAIIPAHIHTHTQITRERERERERVSESDG